MKHIEIAANYSYTNCGDGCCDDWPERLVITDVEKGETLLDSSCADIDRSQLEDLLNKLGFLVEVKVTDTVHEDMERHNSYMESMS